MNAAYYDEMSDSSEQHPDPNEDKPLQPWGEEKIEAELARLSPARVHSDFLAELMRDYERTAQSSSAPGTLRETATSKPIPWARIGLLTVGSFLFALIYLGPQFAPIGSGEVSATEKPLLQASPEHGGATKVSVPAFSQHQLEGGFVPVSSQQFLIKSTSQGYLNTEDGSFEKRQQSYRDAYHWHDPATGTNIRFFTPRNEDVFIPIEIY